MRARKVVIYSGTFDPYHKAHFQQTVTLLEKLRPSLEVDAVWVVVNENPGYKKPILSGQERVRIIKDLLDKHNDASCFKVLLNHNFEKGGVSGILKDCQKKYPKMDFLLFAVPDVVRKVKAWDDREFVCHKINWLITNREGLPKITKEEMKELGFKSFEILDWDSSEMFSSAIKEYYRKHHTFPKDSLSPLAKELLQKALLSEAKIT